MSVAISDDNRYIYSGSEDKSIKVYDLQTGQQVHHILDTHKSTIYIPIYLKFTLLHLRLGYDDCRVQQ